jgi:hypothetical protein
MQVLQKLHERATKAGEAAKEVIGTFGGNSDDTSNEADWSNFAFQNVVEETLPSLSPSILMKLKQVDMTNSNDDDSTDIINDISNALQTILNKQLECARDLLQQLMAAGEIKKLDALIGQASRNSQLNVAFFQVLQMNMQDALLEQQQQQQQTQDNSQQDNDDKDENTANRYQILQHIYTRCQEEVEKTVNPGMALLSKLLRTQVDSIRRNQLEHYLGVPKSTITAPDGKTVELPKSNALVSHADFSQAIATTVRQIRTVENAGGTDKATAADMVESCRTVAKEARIVLGEQYGRDSDVVEDFENALMPIFRPSSPDSPYIQGDDSTNSDDDDTDAATKGKDED